MNKPFFTLASLLGAAMFGSIAPCFAQAPPSFDFNGDGVADRIEYLPAQEIVRVISGANNAVLQTFAAPTSGEGFASSAAVVPDLSGDWAPDLVVGAPMANANGQPAGRVYALSFSGNVLWNAFGPEGARVGYEIGAVADQNNDGTADILAGRSTNGALPTQEAALFSGRTGQLLVVRQGSLDTLKTYVANGGRLYAASDLDDSGAVDQSDLIEFLALLDKGSPTADMNGDGLLNASDLISFINDYVNGVITIQALAAPTSLIQEQTTVGVITDFGGGGCPECLATPASLPASGCQISISCPGAEALPGGCIVVEAVDGPAQCADEAFCWSGTFHPANGDPSVDIAATRVENSGSRATFCFSRPGYVSISVHHACTVDGQPCTSCAKCFVNVAYPASCQLDLSVKVVQAPNGATGSGGGLGEPGPFADPAVVAPATTGWVDLIGNGTVLQPGTPVWREGIIVEGRPAGGQFEVQYVEEDSAGEHVYSMGLVTPSSGFAVARFWQGPSLPDVAGASRLWFMFQTAAELPALTMHQKARFRIRYTVAPCGDVSTTHATDAVFNLEADDDHDHIPNSIERPAGNPPPNWTYLCTKRATWDTDEDLVSDEIEIRLGTDPCVSSDPPVEMNFDRDHLVDYAELAVYGSSPNMFDTDMDGVQDDAEIALNLDPLNHNTNPALGVSIDGERSDYLVHDVDHDALFDLWELKEGLVMAIPSGSPPGGLVSTWPSHPNSDDHDHDGIQDGLEVRLGLDPLVADQNPSAPMDDADNDGLSNELEEELGLNPTNRDSDHDGLSDGAEARLGKNPKNPDSNFNGVPDGQEDSDGDGLSDGDETRRCLNPLSQDTDGDGIPDATDPLPLVRGPFGLTCPKPGAQQLSITIGLAQNGNNGVNQGSFTLSGGTGGGGSLVLNQAGSQNTCCPVPYPPCDWGPPPHDGCIVCGCLPCAVAGVDCPDANGNQLHPSFYTDTWYNYSVTVPCAADHRPALTPFILGNLPNVGPCFDLVPEWDPNGDGANRSSGTTDVPLVGCRQCASCGNGGSTGESCEPGSTTTYNGRVQFKLVPRYPKSIEIIIDDNNERGFELPLPHEEKGDGKLVLVDESDVDEDGIPAFADFSYPDPLAVQNLHFVPVNLRVHVPQPRCPAASPAIGLVEIRITYQQSATLPDDSAGVWSNQVSLNSGSHDARDWFSTQLRESRGMRLWSRDIVANSNSQLDANRWWWSVDELRDTKRGHLIPTGRWIDASLLGIQPTSGTTQSATIYLEAIGPSATACGQPIRVEVRFDGGSNNPAGGENPGCSDSPHNCGLSDAASAICCSIDYADLRWAEPELPDSTNPYSWPMHFTRPSANQTDLSKYVFGSIADGASAVMIRLRPQMDHAPLVTDVIDFQDHLASPSTATACPVEVYGGVSVAASSQSTELSVGSLPVGSDPTTEGWRNGASLRGQTLIYLPPEAYYSAVPSGGTNTAKAQYYLGTDTTLRRNILVDPYTRVAQPPSRTLPSQSQHVTIGHRIRWNGALVGVAAFELHRPPVVFVHGITDNPANCWMYYQEPWDAIPTRLYYADYASTNEDGFDVNYKVIPYTIQLALEQYRSGVDGGHHFKLMGRRIAATRADVIAHSMGGCLTRFYASEVSGKIARGTYTDLVYPQLEFFRVDQDVTFPVSSLPVPLRTNTTGAWPYLRGANLFAGDIRRLISLDTPYKGAPLADASSILFSPTLAARTSREETILWLADNLRGTGQLVRQGRITQQEAHRVWMEMKNLHDRVKHRHTLLLSATHVASGEVDLRRDSVARLIVEGTTQVTEGDGTTFSPRSASFPIRNKSIAWIPVGGIKNQLDSFVDRVEARQSSMPPASQFLTPTRPPPIPETWAGVMSPNLLGLPGAFRAEEGDIGWLSAVIANSTVGDTLAAPTVADVAEAGLGLVSSTEAGLLRGDGTVPLLSQLCAVHGQSLPRLWRIAEMHCHTMSQSGNVETGSGTWSMDPTIPVIWEPINWSRSMPPWIGEMLSGPKERFNFDSSDDGSDERLGR